MLRKILLVVVCVLISGCCGRTEKSNKIEDIHISNSKSNSLNYHIKKQQDQWMRAQKQQDQWLRDQKQQAAQRFRDQKQQDQWFNNMKNENF